MKERDLHLLEIRPDQSSGEVTKLTGPDEQFQNATLRPVVALQNDLLTEVFKNYIHKHKNGFYDLSINKKMMYIESAVQKDVKFRNSLKGMIIGQFTIHEYRFYVTNSSALNKRMMRLVTESLQNNIQLFHPISAP